MSPLKKAQNFNFKYSAGLGNDLLIFQREGRLIVNGKSVPEYKEKATFKNVAPKVAEVVRNDGNFSAWRSLHAHTGVVLMLISWLS